MNRKATKKQTTKTTKKRRTTLGKDNILQLAPIIIKGSSMHVDFNPPFDDRDRPGNRVSKTKHPITTKKIVRVIVTDHDLNILNEFELPGRLRGKCFIFIQDS